MAVPTTIFKEHYGASAPFFYTAFRLWECGFHTLIHTYEKAACQVNKLYHLTFRGPQIGLIAKHLSVFT